MKKGWETKKLEDVCEYISRGVSPKYTPKGGVFVLNQRCVRNHEISYDEAKRHDINNKEVSEVKYLQVGDVLVNSTGVGTLGRVAQVNSIKEPTIVDSHITIVRPNKDIFYPSFFGWAMVFIEELISSLGAGASGQTELARTVLQEMEISFPKSLPEQQRIVTLLDETFAGLAQVHANAERNLVNAREVFEGLLIKVFLEGMNNKKWNLEKLEKHNKVVVGYVGPISKDYTNDDDGVLLLSTKNISGDGINLEKLTKINRQFHNKNKKSQLVPRDILVARHGNSGQAAVIPNSIKEAHALNVIVIKNSSTISSEYLAFLLNSGVLDKISSSKAGSVQAIINTSIIKDLVIPVPPLEEQRAIVGRLDGLAAETSRLEGVYQSKLEAVEELRKSVLAKAFAGEL